jgi:AcrR family transcriptional regulator
VGRRRDTSLDAAILAAAGECIAEAGLAAFTVEAVADRVGIPKSTLYKRWPSRTDLLAGTLANWMDEMNDPRFDSNLGDIRTYLTRLVEQEIHLCRTRRGRAAAQLLLATFDDDGPPASPVIEAARARRQTARITVINAASTGGLPADTDPDVLLDLLLGAIWGSVLAGKLPQRTHARRVVDAILNGFQQPKARR